MESRVQITEYKKSFWKTLKEKIMNIFLKNKKYIEEQNIINEDKVILEKVEDKSKKEFMNI